VENWPGILTRIAADMVTDGFRRRRSRAGDRHVALDAIEEPSDNILASPESILQGRQRITIVDETLKTLSSDCRRAFMLVRFYGYSYAEVASELGIKPVAVGRLIEQASSRVTKAAIGNA
jgi:RNA polymerase sigma factor (sigma-70 family)